MLAADESIASFRQAFALDIRCENMWIRVVRLPRTPDYAPVQVGVILIWQPRFPAITGHRQPCAYALGRDDVGHPRVCGSATPMNASIGELLRAEPGVALLRLPIPFRFDGDDMQVAADRNTGAHTTGLYELPGVAQTWAAWGSHRYRPIMTRRAER